VVHYIVLHHRHGAVALVCVANVLAQSRQVHRGRRLDARRDGNCSAGNLLERLAFLEGLSFLCAQCGELSCYKGLGVVVVVCPFTLGAVETGCAVRGFAGLWVVGFRGRDKTLATTAREVDYKGGHHEAGESAADDLVQFDDFAEGSPEVFYAFHHVALVDVILCVVSNGSR
jgi:hypothetical protein